MKNFGLVFSSGTTDIIFILDILPFTNSFEQNTVKQIKEWVINVTENFPTDSSFQVGVVAYDEPDLYSVKINNYV